ncbi:MAG: peptidase M19 [Rhizobiales bacterium]|nr:peptidase M19 [Hyphomicrobiales bacterium]
MSNATKIVRDALVWDQLFPATEYCGTWTAHELQLDHMRQAGYDAVSITVAYDPEDTMTAIRRISHWRKFIRRNDDRFLLLLSAGDAERAKAEGKLAIGFHFQGTTPFGRDLGLVEMFYNLGVRHALLAYNHRNNVGDGIHERTDSGLSKFGRELIAEMQRVGMLVDCSHTGSRTALEAFELAAAPVIYSHANPAAVFEHDRNLSDDMARACAATGGMIGLNGVGMFLGPSDDLVELLFRHVDHWCQVIGAASVGLGLDMVTDPSMTLAAMAQDTARWPADQGYQTDDLPACGPDCLEGLTERLLKAGYSPNDCRGVLGENWLRLAREVWKTPA